ncbi:MULTISPECIES: hypothetical protein [Bacteria]|uniref:F0F1 ATP synthase subunit B family protein n=1 Tax=Bacteria TaxID=2 RepID=UPI00103E1695|nr:MULTISPECIES: hypothetical protein [Bacteria]QDM40282.1 hypothetical protein C0V74_03840 [Altererythrobacter sp. TH136]TCJ37155.1 hypothetical protein E0504_18950 [Parafrankia sp. BMG5.11]
MSALPALVEEQPAGHTEVNGHVEETLLGLGAEGWVYVSLTIFFLLAIFVAKAPQKIAAALDAQIAEKRRNLDEAARIRAEAQALLDQAKAEHAQSAQEAAALLDHARADAAKIVEQAEADTALLLERRAAAAESKIGAAERAAVDELRREAAAMASQAAARLIAAQHGEDADRRLADQLISTI